jgi:hypothetical protein
LEPFVFLLHRTVWCHTRQSSDLSLLHSDFCRGTVHLSNRPSARRESLLRWLTGQSRGTLDSSVNYSGAHREDTREWLVRWLLAWCTRHCPVHTGQCPVRHFPAHYRSFAPNLIMTLTEILSWFVLNLMHL